MGTLDVNQLQTLADRLGIRDRASTWLGSSGWAVFGAGLLVGVAVSALLAREGRSAIARGDEPPVLGQM